MLIECICFLTYSKATILSKPYFGWLSGDFSSSQMGLQWQSFRHFPSERIHLANGKLEMEAQGNSFEDSPSLPVNAGNKKYEIQIECTIDDSTTAGLTLFYNELANVWIAVNTDHFAVYNHQSRKISVKNDRKSWLSQNTA